MSLSGLGRQTIAIFRPSVEVTAAVVIDPATRVPGNPNRDPACTPQHSSQRVSHYPNIHPSIRPLSSLQARWARTAAPTSWPM